MRNIIAVSCKELKGYFETPVAYVFMVVFLMLSGMFTFYLGGFYDAEQANLSGFFNWHPWLYLFLIPAISMRLWAEERRSGTIEILLTLPISTFESVVGKFIAAWIFAGISLLLTFPMWLTVNYLGDPDNGIIIISYIGSFIMGGAFLAVGSCISAMTQNQVVSFVISITVCFLFTVSGFPIVLDFFSALNLPQFVIDTVSSFSFIQNFDDILKGSLSLKNIVYFVSFIVLWLYINIVVIDTKRA
ncbi:MAG: ABC transporter permease [Alphaproteobacteria bacterium CG11_big_fil_rev_8_21_14_0_20_39_49]|nr:MAG: ABC transporter permease [Alphaproteobacteria bacterium CG11_big_fil_rev_8_21_14_0_20_39_49]